jgi:hypothetical protein
MADGTHFWAFNGEEVAPPSTNVQRTLKAITLIINESHIDAPKRAALVNYRVHARLISEALRENLMSLLPRTSESPESSYLEKEDDVPGATSDEPYSKDVRKHLRLITKSPEEARIAFPNPDQRNKIVPLLEHLERKVAEIRARTSSSI